MIYGDEFKITLQNAAGLYYTATLNGDNSYTVTTGAGVSYIKNLPKGWQDFSISFERNMTYYGIVRSQSDKFIFVLDARAILLSLLFGGGGVSAYCKITIWQPNTTTFTYDIFYVSEIDLSSAKDDKKLQQLEVSTLDSKLLELVKAKSSSKINIPFWSYSAPTWSVANDAKFIWHDGIKLYWRADFFGGETSAAPFAYTTQGFNGGRHGALPNQGAHTLPALSNKIIVQDNGTTTYIGNDILQPFLRSAAQQPAYNEVSFTDQQNRNISYACPIQPMVAEVAVDFVFDLSGTFVGNVLYPGGVAFELRFVLFELNENGDPTETTPGQYDIFSVLYTLALPSGGSPYTPPSPNFSSTNTIGLNPAKAYVLGIIFDDAAGTTDTTNVCIYTLSALNLSIYSDSNSGTATAVEAPMLPASTIIALKPHKVFQAIVANLDSTRTNAYGFPVAPSSGYTGYSDYLADDARTPEIDYVPALTWISTENALRDINGFPYMTWTLQDFFNTFDRLGMIGMSVEDDVLRLEDRAFFFDDATEILDLGENVAELEIIPFVEIMGNNIKAGYGDPQTNKNFAADSFAIPQDYDLPLNKTPKTIDMQITQANADMYFIEKARAQNNSDDSNSSSSNGNVLIEVIDTIVETPTISNPAGADVTVSAYGIKKYPTAQSTDPTAATDPYIKGFRYPETVINTGITPASNIRRNGRWWRVLMDGFGTAPATDYISYRTQYQQRYNDPSAAALTLPGMSKNIDGTNPVDEVEDIDVTNFGSPLFRPYILRFKSGYPDSMYNLINANPYGYISFTWKKVEFKGFLYRVTQCVGNKKSTIFELLAHPTTSNADLRIS